MSILITAVGGILAVAIYNLATQERINAVAAAVIGIGANVLFATFSAQWLLESAMRYARYRTIFDKRSQFEGHWFSVVNNLPHRPYEIAVIAYNPESCGYVYSGRSLTKDFEVVADWGSTHAEIDVQDSRVRFIYEGSVLAGNDVIQGFGYIYFDRSPSGVISTGRGFFVDADQLAGAHYHHFTMRRVSDDEIRESIPNLSPGRSHGKVSIGLRSDQDYMLLARHLLKI